MRKKRNHQHNQGVHDGGIDSLANELMHKRKHHILSIIPNVLYNDYSTRPIIQGEIDLLVLYNDGGLGLYEVKSNLTKATYEKAQSQLLKMSRVFKHYSPELASYIAKERVTIPYEPPKERVRRR